MTEDLSSSPEWTKEHVLRKLINSSENSDAVIAQIFLDDTISMENVENAVRQIIDTAYAQIGNVPQPIDLLKIHKQAKSFNIKGSIELLSKIANSELVKEILPAEIDDIYPKPVRK